MANDVTLAEEIMPTNFGSMLGDVQMISLSTHESRPSKSGRNPRFVDDADSESARSGGRSPQLRPRLWCSMAVRSCSETKRLQTDAKESVREGARANGNEGIEGKGGSRFAVNED